MGKKVKVVFDSNVWVSIFMKKNVSDEFFPSKQKLTVYISRAIILEITKVLLYPKITKILEKSGFNEKDLLHAIEENSTVVTPKVRLVVVEEDAEDNKVLECALASGADFVVSGDKHLLRIGKFRKTRILSPRDFFDTLK